MTVCSAAVSTSHGLARVSLRAGDVSASTHGHRTDDGVGLATTERARGSHDRGGRRRRRSATAATGNQSGVRHPRGRRGLRHRSPRGESAGVGAQQWS